MAWHSTPGSSNVSGFGWDGGELTVEFRSGERYTGLVPESTYLEMQRVRSVGSFVARNLNGVLVRS